MRHRPRCSGSRPRLSLKGSPRVGARSSSAQTLEQLELTDAFNVAYTMPSLGHTETLTVLRELGVSNIPSLEPALRTVSKGIPIKKLLLVVEMSMQPDSKELHPKRFA